MRDDGASGPPDAVAARRAGETNPFAGPPALEPELDVFLCGPLFVDIVFSGLPRYPSPGTEVWARGMGSLPGGIANLAVAATRLGMRTGLAAGFGADVYGGWMWNLLSEEGIDLRWSTRLRTQHTNVTVSFSHGGDRSMITHGHELPISYDELIGDPPLSRAVITDLDPRRAQEQWWRAAADSGALVFASAGWDPSEVWSRHLLDPLARCHALLTNEVEATSYTRTDTAEKALATLAEQVPVAVVTLGGRGAIAVDGNTGEQAQVSAVPVEAIDLTGAGDVFAAAFASATLWGWPLAERLAFAALCSALAVQEFGGSLAAPGMGDIEDWWQRTRRAAQSGAPAATELFERYAFLEHALPHRPARVARRAEATFALSADLR